jgi:hypothetical protein
VRSHLNNLVRGAVSQGSRAAEALREVLFEG